VFEPVSPEEFHKLSIYEMNVRQFTNAGTFKAIESGGHIERLREMGVGVIWFMPIHPIGVKNRIGSLGSYYAVKDYMGVNPEFGTADDFKSLINRIHNNGMLVMIDWVANHTAWDNVLTTTHPEYYVRQNGNFIIPPGTNWNDVIELDFNNAEMRQYQINAMKFWVEEFDIDGFRCDAASEEFVPLSFWKEAVAELAKLIKPVIMLAEADGAKYHQAFSVTYNWGLLGRINNVAGMTQSASQLANYVQNDNNTYPASAYRLNFITNHDENSWNGTEYERLGDAVELFTVFTYVIKGTPLIYSGQEAGMNKRLAFFDRDPIPWKDHPMTQLYKGLNRLKKENKSIWGGINGGSFSKISTDQPVVYSILRQKDSSRVFAVFNMSNTSRTIKFSGTAHFGSYKVFPSGNEIVIDSSSASSLNPWSYVLYYKN